MAVAAHTQEPPNYMKRTLCPECQKSMRIVRIDRLGLGYDIRTLECRDCKRDGADVVKRAA